MKTPYSKEYKAAYCAKWWRDKPQSYKNAYNDHTTKKVRGLLCTSYNHLLGKAKDDPRILKAAVKYLATVR